MERVERYKNCRLNGYDKSDLDDEFRHVRSIFNVI